jgi:hypothetical protein
MANRILTDTPHVTWDFSTPGQAKANCPDLEARIAALETEVFPPSQVLTLPPGATWTQFVAAYNSLSGYGGDILEFQGEILQTSSWVANKPIWTRGVPGTGAKLTLHGNTEIYGANQQVTISTFNAKFSDFEVFHDRSYGGPSFRTIAFSLGNPCINITFDNITLTDITNDCFILRTEGFSAGADSTIIDGVYIDGCTANDWWESFFNIHEGSARNVYVTNNNCHLLKGGNPNTAVSRPYACIINLEDPNYPGLITNINITNNSFISTLYDFTGGVGGQAGNGTDWLESIGFAMRQNGDTDFRCDNIQITDNLFQGWHRSLKHIQTQTGGGSVNFPGDSTNINYLRNTHSLAANPIATVDNSGGINDVVTVGGNTWVLHQVGQVGLELPNSNPGYVDIVQNPANTTTGP